MKLFPSVKTTFVVSFVLAAVGSSYLSSTASPLVTVAAARDCKNCNCAQCAEAGFSHQCVGNKECYNSETTCSIMCSGGKKNCISTASCNPPSMCSAEQQQLCNPETSTCCLHGTTNEPFCSPAPNATCCQYGDMSCPTDYTCYPPSGMCRPPSPSSPNCDVCKSIISAIETKACGACNSLFPKYKWLCTLIDKLGLCSWIQKKGLPPQTVCSMMGFCGESGCSCGYCRPQLFGQWCLSLPNKCPKVKEGAQLLLADGSSNNNGDESRFKTVEEAEAHVTAAIRKMLAEDDAKPKRNSAGHHLAVMVEKDGTNNGEVTEDIPNLKNFCLDGICDRDHIGCCLTCA